MAKKKEQDVQALVPTKRQESMITSIVNKVHQQEQTGMSAVLNIALLMNKFDENELYKVTGHKSTAKWAEETFDYKTSSTSAMLRVAKRFLIANKTGNFEQTKFIESKDEKDFNLTQMVEMLPIKEDEQVIELVKDGVITPDMSAHKIREVVKSITRPQDELEEDDENVVDVEGTVIENDSIDEEIEQAENARLEEIKVAYANLTASVITLMNIEDEVVQDNTVTIKTAVDEILTLVGILDKIEE